VKVKIVKIQNENIVNLTSHDCMYLKPRTVPFFIQTQTLHRAYMSWVRYTCYK